MTKSERERRDRAGKERRSRPDEKERASSLRYAFGLLVVCVLAASAGRLRIPAGRRNTLVVLTGGPLLLMLAAMACGMVALLSVPVQRLHQGGKAKEYEAFRWLVLRIGAAFAIASLLTFFYLGLRG